VLLLWQLMTCRDAAAAATAAAPVLQTHATGHAQASGAHAQLMLFVRMTSFRQHGHQTTHISGSTRL
jgi:hypothetical protein